MHDPAPSEHGGHGLQQQLIEHVHPDDLVQQLGSVRSVLRPNGTYLGVTPNRLNGPHGISKYFDDEATGLHIKEYTNAELQALFLAAGFFDCCAYAGLCAAGSCAIWRDRDPRPESAGPRGEMGDA